MIAQPHTPAPAHAGISERLSCSLAAAQRFQVPANVILAVATVENGRAGLWVPNANGSYDLGAMQLNTAYVATLARYGIRPDHVLAPGCYAYNLAAWRLHNHLAHDAGDAWQRVANYNSRTPIYNLQYQARLAPAAAAWRSWLEAYLPKMANIGGPELAAPAVPGPLVLQTAADRPKPSRAHRRNPVWQASLATQSCGVACAPMRVERSSEALERRARPARRAADEPRTSMHPALLGFAALLQTATPLATPDWRVVAYGTDGSQVSTDLDRLSCMGALCSATEMTEYLHPTPTGVTRSVDDVQYDCEKATTRTLAETSFDARGRQLEHLNAPTAWALIEADTIGFQALAYVCSPRTAERKIAGEVATVSTSASGPTAPAPKTLSSNHDDAATVQIASSPTADQARSAIAALDRGHPEAATFE